MKPTNIICTINPSNASVERIERLIYRGMAIARINLSHSNIESNLKLISNIRQAAANVTHRTQYVLPLAIALDLRGAEIRVGEIGENLNRILADGDINVKFSCDSKYDEVSPIDLAYVPCSQITRFLKKGHKVLINHGRIELKVVGAFLNGDFFCNVIKGGELRSGQDIFFPEVFKFLNLKPIHDDDLIDMKFAVENNIDFIIASHVEHGLVIREIKSHLSGGDIKVLAKIQNRYAVDEISDIIAESDGIIFAPSVEIETKVIPFMYRIAQYMCKVNMKVMFIALDAPLEYTEECEVVNWLMSSGDGSMICRDAAEGREQLATLTRLEGINSFMASHADELCSQVDEFCLHYHDQLIVLASSAVTESHTTSASAIFILSENDLLASGVYFHLPKCVVIPIVENDKIARQLNIFNGFVPLCWRDAKMMMMSDDDKVAFGVAFAKQRGLIKCGDTIIILTDKYSRIEYLSYDSN